MRVAWTLELSPRGGGTHVVEHSRWQPTNLLGTAALHLIRKWQIPTENQQSLARLKAIVETGKS